VRAAPDVARLQLHRPGCYHVPTWPTAPRRADASRTTFLAREVARRSGSVTVPDSVADVTTLSMSAPAIFGRARVEFGAFFPARRVGESRRNSARSGLDGIGQLAPVAICINADLG